MIDEQTGAKLVQFSKTLQEERMAKVDTEGMAKVDLERELAIIKKVGETYIEAARVFQKGLAKGDLVGVTDGVKDFLRTQAAAFAKSAAMSDQ